MTKPTAAAPPAAAGAAGAAAAAAEVPVRSKLATRIKKLMQKDDDIGKISLYTPLALGARGGRWERGRL